MLGDLVLVLLLGDYAAAACVLFAAVTHIRILFPKPQTDGQALRQLSHRLHVVGVKWLFEQ